MACYDRDEVPMLSDTHPQSSENNQDSQFQTFFSRTRSASISIPMNSIESYENTNLVGHTGPLRNERKTPFMQMSGPLYISRKPENSFHLNQSAAACKMVESKAEKFPSFNGMGEKDWSDNNYAGKNEHLLRSGQLGMCNDPYCTTCPTYYNFKAGQQKNSKASGIFDTKFHNALYGDAKGWARRLMSFLCSYVPGVMNPHAKVVQQWNKFFVISCLMAVFIDPLFFFLLSVQKDNKCIIINWPATKAFVALRSMTDVIYLINMLLQFRLAYIAPESRVVGAGELVDHPKKIAVNYLSRYFFLDLFVVLPLPQIMITLVLPKYLGSSGANFAKNLLRTAVLVQYLPRLYRFLPFLAGQSPSGFIFESAWANFVINLLTFMLSGHVVGSCWYLFGLQRVNQCLRNACHNSKIRNCTELIDCGYGHISQKKNTNNTNAWRNNTNASACFTDGFSYGIYVQTVNLTTKRSITTRYVYSLFWGFQQISTLAGNQTPSYFVWEVLFTMAIVGLGLLLFALLIGNMQNFLQALGRRLAYIAPESRVVGAGELVDHPKKIAVNYLSRYFFLDLFVVLPLPQIMITLVLPKYLGSSGANFAKNLLRTAVLVQYLPRLYRFLPFLAGQSPSGFIFESAWANFVINLLTFMLSGHVVGSCWYLFGLQRVNQCLRNACHNSKIRNCTELIDCGYGHISQKKNTNNTNAWRNNTNASACFTDGFSYGIYVQTVNLTTKRSITTRYVYSLFWGFQQISTLAGNQTPSYFVWEVLFTMAIVGLGLLLFALLIGNMQNFLQALGRRRLEMSLRRRDVEQWMSHRRLPEELRRKVREAERYNWAATRGVNEEMLFENLPEDLQREIRRHLFKFVKKVRIFALMDDPILDAICERIRQKTYIKGSNVLSPGSLIEKMVFIVRGKMESVGENGIIDPLSEGDVCGEELLTWCLEHSSVNRDGKKIRIPGKRLLSNRKVKCLTNVEAFSLRAADLEEVTCLFSRFLRNPRVQGAIRYESPYWRSFAAARIQVTWRYRKKRLNRADTSQSASSSG